MAKVKVELRLLISPYIGAYVFLFFRFCFCLFLRRLSLTHFSDCPIRLQLLSWRVHAGKGAIVRHLNVESGEWVRELADAEAVHRATDK